MQLHIFFLDIICFFFFFLNSLNMCCEPDHTLPLLPAPCSPSLPGIPCSIKHVRVEEDLGTTFGDESLG